MLDPETVPRTRARRAWLTLGFVLVVGSEVAGQQTALTLPAPRIGTIEVVSNEVFDVPSRGLSAPYRIANGIHIHTRERVVRRELLFASGDPLDPELLEQTERNLRALRFIRDARVESIPIDEDGDGHSERVDLRVVTWDTWSLAPRVDFEQVGDRTIWEAGASEKNLFGLGKEVTYSHRTNLDRTIDRFVYFDPQLVGSRLALKASVAKLSDGDEESLSLSRPYFSLDDPWAFLFNTGTFSRTDPLFQDGIEVERLRHRAQWGDIEFGRALRRHPTSAVRFHAAYRLRQERVAGVGRDFGIVEVGLQSVEHRFSKLTHVNRFERTEDFNLGARSYGTIGLSTSALGGGANRVLFAAAGHSRALDFRPDHFLAAGVDVAGRSEQGQWLNGTADIWLRYLLKSSQRSALVGRAKFRHGHNLDPEIQVLLGAESGLRGYPVRQFVGTRALLLSVEHRWFLADEIAQLLSLGIAGFIDSGFAWTEDESIDLSDLKTAVGASLLVGSNRLASRGGVRFDIGYGLNRVLGADRWVVSAGSSIDF